MTDPKPESIVRDERAQLDYAHSMSYGDYLHIEQVLSAQHLNRPGNGGGYVVKVIASTEARFIA